MSEKVREGNCERCGVYSHELFPIKHEVENEYGDSEKKTSYICWSCDFDILNGRGDMSDDPGEVYMDHWEEAYSYDPINTPPPPGYH